MACQPAEFFASRNDVECVHPQERKSRPAARCRQEPFSLVFSKAFKIFRVGAQIFRQAFESSDYPEPLGNVVDRLSGIMLQIVLQSFANNLRLRLTFKLGPVLQLFFQGCRDPDCDAVFAMSDILSFCLTRGAAPATPRHQWKSLQGVRPGRQGRMDTKLASVVISVSFSWRLSSWLPLGVALR